MKQAILSLLAAVAACSEPPWEEPGHPVDDAGLPLTPDATPSPSDINPPLTPDDPCRQLKAEVPEGVYWAGAGYQGDLLIVVYQTQTPAQTRALVYRDDVLVREDMVHAGYATPSMYYERNELRIALAPSGENRTRIYLVADDGMVQPLRVVENLSAYGASYGVTPDDDLLTAIYATGGWLATVNIPRMIEQSFINSPGIPAVSWWPMRIGDPAVARLLWSYQTTMETLSMFYVDYGLATGAGAMTMAQWMVGAPGALLLGGAAISETSMGVYTLMDNTTLQHRVLDAVMGQLDVRTAPGRPISTIAAHDGSVYLLTSRLGADGETASWVLLRDSYDAIAARDGKAGVTTTFAQYPLLALDGVVTWAAPTIPDDGPRIAPTSAIAVCSYTL